MKASKATTVSLQKRIVDAQNREKNVFLREIRDQIYTSIGNKRNLSLTAVKQIIKDSVSKIESKSNLKIIELDKEHKEDFEGRVFGWLSSKGIKGLKPEEVQTILKELFPDKLETPTRVLNGIEKHIFQPVHRKPAIINLTDDDEPIRRIRLDEDTQKQIELHGNPNVLIKRAFRAEQNVPVLDKLQKRQSYTVYQKEITEVGKKAVERNFTARLLKIENKFKGEVVILTFENQKENIVSSFGDIYLWNHPALAPVKKTIACKGTKITENLQPAQIYNIFNAENLDTPLISNATFDKAIPWNHGIIFLFNSRDKVINSGDYSKGLVFVEVQ